MPPQISSDEGSDSEPEVVTKTLPSHGKGRAKAKAKPVVEDKELQVESEDEEGDDDELDEDEFVVEKVLNHMVNDETGELLFEVKWEGYEKKSDRTWEPEDNLIESATLILSNYLESVGGRDTILEAYNEKKTETAGKKKRGRASSRTPNGAAKKAKKNGRLSHPASATPPASVEKSEFKPPSGNWEDEVVGIDACEGTEGKVVVYLTWKNGNKSQHPLQQVYKRCPQKMLKFYESHLVFKQSQPQD